MVLEWTLPRPKNHSAHIVEATTADTKQFPYLKVRAMAMSDNHGQSESIGGILSSILGYIMAHFFSVDAIFFKVVIAPAIGATIGFFVVRFWKKLFDKNEKSDKTNE